MDAAEKLTPASGIETRRPEAKTPGEQPTTIEAMKTMVLNSAHEETGEFDQYSREGVSRLTESGADSAETQRFMTDFDARAASLLAELRATIAGMDEEGASAQSTQAEQTMAAVAPTEMPAGVAETVGSDTIPATLDAEYT
ncbi:MAG: hypothetical protein PHT12_02375, partial [Patescibacteria group bacterium]|nr:hypothetical protein [Patescibacteria group bacterium]